MPRKKKQSSEAAVREIRRRAPSLDQDTLDEILSRLPEKGYSRDRLQWTLQGETD